jgi:hypothetical protein
MRPAKESTRRRLGTDCCREGIASCQQSLSNSPTRPWSGYYEDSKTASSRCRAAPD